MTQVQAGGRGAFEELVRRYRQPVMNFVGRTLPDAAEAEDIAQGVFVQVFKAAARYRPEAKFSTWLFTIARNLCLNELRRRGRHPAESLTALTDESGTGRPLADSRAAPPTTDLLRAELERKVEEAIADLPENQRTALLLCREGEVAYEDIAAVLGVSLSAVKSLIFRGRETLKARLKPYLETGAWDDSPGRNFSP